jgi:hypothetical protein
MNCTNAIFSSKVAWDTFARKGLLSKKLDKAGSIIEQVASNKSSLLFYKTH